MNRQVFSTLVSFFSILVFSQVAMGNPPQVSASWGQLPLAIEANQGQTDTAAKFVAHIGASVVHFYPDHVTISIISATPKKTSGLAKGKVLDANAGVESDQDIVRAQIKTIDIGASTPELVGMDPLPGVSNYFNGPDSSTWILGVKQYAKIVYKNVYPGIDKIFYGTRDQLEYDWIVHPSADPSQIQFTFDGAKSIATAANGALVLTTDAGVFHHLQPVASQKSIEVSNRVQANYRIDKGMIRLELGRYDRSKALTIDPVLRFSSYLPSAGARIALDSASNVYLQGLRYDNNQLTDAGQRGVWNPTFTKVKADGSAVVYTNYVSGAFRTTNGGIGVDGAGNVVIAFNVTQGGANIPKTVDAFRTNCANANTNIMKFGSDGQSLIYSTLLCSGPLPHPGPPLITTSDIAVDQQGNAYVVGLFNGPAGIASDPANANKFPLVNSIPDMGDFAGGFITKLNPAGTGVVYSTPLNGNKFSSSDCVTSTNAVAIDGAGAAYVIGRTTCDGFPVLNAFQPSRVADPGGTGVSFVVKVSPAGNSLAYSSMFGGLQFVRCPNNDAPNAIAVDSIGAAYIVGNTCADDFPTINAFQAAIQQTGGGDGFILKVNPRGNTLAYSTFLGGANNHTTISHVAVDDAFNAHVIGITAATNYTLSSNLPYVNVLPQAAAFTTTGGQIFFGKLTAAGNEFYYLTPFAEGGFGGNAIVDIASNHTGSVFISGQNNAPQSNLTFPVPTLNSLFPRSDGFLAKIDDPDSANNPSMVVTSSNNPSESKTDVTFAVRLPASSGTVTFKDGPKVLGTISVTSTANGSISTDSATFTTAALAEGLHSITATYTPVTGAPVRSRPLVQAVNAATVCRSN